MASSNLSIRPYEGHDETAVLALINADRLPGQPETTTAMLAEALAGRSPHDSGWWMELDPPRTDVVCDDHGTVLGVVSYARRESDDAGLILWLHCRGEDETLTDTLIAHTLTALTHSPTVYAFEFASALALGLEGLAASHRPGIHHALTRSGFIARARWRYMGAPLPIPGLPHATDYSLIESHDPPGKQLEIHQHGERTAHAIIGTPTAGIGVLWWIEVAEHARGHGLGRNLLDAALDQLTRDGARHVILYVDDDAPATANGRDRRSANKMYDRAGLTEIDRLFSYERHTSGSHHTTTAVST